MARSHRCPWSRNNSLNLPFSLFKGPLLLFEFLLLSIHTHTHTRTRKHIHTFYTTHAHNTHTHAIRRSNRPWTHHFLSRTPHTQHRLRFFLASSFILFSPLLLLAPFHFLYVFLVSSPPASLSPTCPPPLPACWSPRACIAAPC